MARPLTFHQVDFTISAMCPTEAFSVHPQTPVRPRKADIGSDALAASDAGDGQEVEEDSSAFLTAHLVELDCNVCAPVANAIAPSGQTLGNVFNFMPSTRRTVRSSTSAPFPQSDHRESSLGEWLIPPMLGMKIMPMGPSFASHCAS